MKSHNFDKKKFEQKLESLEVILASNEDLDINILPLKEKVHDVKESLKSDTIKIVLLGSFSDGKTSTVAGLLGHLENNMKIDPDESSDELEVYRPSGLKQGFEIVDTPGLFGTKEKEVEGSNIKFSEITERYISEAHIIMYVTHAVNPIKESHLPILKRVIKDYGKLDSLVVTLNRMDETGIDMSDDEDYEEKKEIKINNVKSRLSSSIGLSPSELEKLTIVCVAANPKGKGLDYWFEQSHIERYNELSRISNLRDAISTVVDTSDVDILMQSQSVAVISDLAQRAYRESKLAIMPVIDALKKARLTHENLKSDLEILENKLKASRKHLIDSLDDYRLSLINDINGTTNTDTIEALLDSQLGISKESIDYHLVTNKINRIISDSVEANEGALKSCIQVFENAYNKQNKILDDVFSKGIVGLKRMKIDGNMVLKIRDFLKIPHKFKPWGAIKFAKNLGVALQFIFDAADIYYSYKQKQKADNLKKTLKADIEKFFIDVTDMLTNNELFYKTFYPSYIELRTVYQERLSEFEELDNAIGRYNKLQQDIKSWYGDDIEDVEFEEID